MCALSYKTPRFVSCIPLLGGPGANLLLPKVPLQVESTMEDAENIDVAIGPTFIRDSVVPVEQNPDTGVLPNVRAIAYFGRLE